MLADIAKFERELKETVEELISEAGLVAGQVLIIGCSTSEVLGRDIGQGGSMEVATALQSGVKSALQNTGVALAVQCCEHLNRALVVERELAQRLNLVEVSAVPHPTAGGAFATAVYQGMAEPVLVEEIKADAGMDIGNTLIGMHLKQVAVPLRLSRDKLGEAALVFARTRPKLIGGERAQYK